MPGYLRDLRSVQKVATVDRTRHVPRGLNVEASAATAPLEGLRREAQRSLWRARNGIKVLTGTVRPQVGASPKHVVWTRGKATLARYESDKRTRRPPVVIVWSIVSRSYILDLIPGRSFISQLLDAGVDVFLLDWGVPDEVDAGNTLELYVDNYMPRALDRALEVAETDGLDLLGYCAGGALSVLFLAGHAEAPVRNLVVMATPIDFQQFEGLVKALERGQLEVDDVIDDTGNIPPDVVYRAFASLRPTADVFKYANLWERLWNDEFVESYEAMAQWIRDQTPLPGAVARQFADLLLRRNLLASGEFPLGRRKVKVADVGCPLLNVIAEQDHMVPPASSEVLTELVGSEDVTELRIPAGHIGLAAGRDAAKITVPGIVEWLKARSS
jgi:polyhydroxyalkanoate synthase subunit PhaC